LKLLRATAEPAAETEEGEGECSDPTSLPGAAGAHAHATLSQTSEQRKRGRACNAVARASNREGIWGWCSKLRSPSM